MSEPAGTGTPEPPNDIDALERDIAATREELGETVDALTSKLDVKSQAQAKVQEVKGQAQVKVRELREQATHATETGRRQAQENPKAAAGVGAAVVSAVAAVVGLKVWLGRRRSAAATRRRGVDRRSEGRQRLERAREAARGNR